jgi:hypothetical protein
MPRPARTDNPENVTVYISEQARALLASLAADGTPKGRIVEAALECYAASQQPEHKMRPRA